MRYFVIRTSLDKKVIGNYPQVKEVKQNCHVWDEPKFVEHLHFKKAEFEPITANAILYSKSKLTDLIDVTGMGFTKKLLVSGKLKTILESNRKTGLQFFRSGVFHKDSFIEDYWVLNMFEDNMEYVDYDKSEFLFRKRKAESGTYIEKVNISSSQSFMNILANKGDYNYTQFFIEKIKLVSQISEDFFMLLHVNGGVKYVVSEKLKKEIEETGCTGIEFMPIELTLNEWLHSEREKVYGKG